MSVAQSFRDFCPDIHRRPHDGGAFRNLRLDAVNGQRDHFF
jgi:hypothetical protein